MTPPEAFVADLALYDPELRVRWSRHRAKFGKPLWAIERRVPEQAPQHAAHLKALDLSHARVIRGCQHVAYLPTCRKCAKALGRARTLDLWEGMRDGYAHVMDVHPSLLTWSQVAPVLAKADAWRTGGMQKIADAFDAQDEVDEKARDRHAASVIADRAYGVADEVARAQKRQVFVPVEVKEGFTVTDRRRLVTA